MHSRSGSRALGGVSFRCAGENNKAGGRGQEGEGQTRSLQGHGNGPLGVPVGAGHTPRGVSIAVV